MDRKINKIAILIAKLLISSGLLYLVLSKAGIERVLSIIRTVNPLAFVLAVFTHLFAQYIATARWRLLLPEEFRGKRLFSLYLIGSFFNTFLPGVIGGDAVKTYYLYKETSKGSLSIASVFMDRFIGYVSLMTMGLVAYILGYKYIKGSIIEWLLPVIILSFALASLIVFWGRVGKRIKLLAEFYEYFYAYRSQFSIIMKTLALSLVVQGLSILALYTIALGLGQHISLAYFFIFFPIIVTISTIPISISGIGLREGTIVLLFGLIGMKPDMATAMSFAWFLSVATGGLVGLVEYLRLKR